MIDNSDSTEKILSHEQVQSNQTVLLVTTVGFLLFLIAEIIGALAGHSLSLLGDAAAMSVDVFTYLCNMYAENVKARFGSIDRNTRLVIEVYIPSFSVVALMGVSIYVATEAVKVLLSKNVSADSTNVLFLWLFSSANAVIDIISGCMIFVRRKEIFHQNSHVFLEVHHDNVELEVRNAHVKDDVEKGQEKVANVNMISACTHIGGDSMRTAAVFIAASVTSTTRVSSTDCDAWASIVILLTITIMVLPLVREIYMACRRI